MHDWLLERHVFHGLTTVLQIRKQRVGIKGQALPSSEVRSAITQGFALGAGLLNTFINAILGS